MRRANGVLASLRLIESFLLTRPSPSRSLHSQVTHYSHLSPFTFSSSLQNQAHNFNFPNNTHQRFYSSSKHNSIVELITTNDWSDFLEQDLERSDPKLINHGTVVYVLKSLETIPLKALHFFNWVSDKNEFNPSLIHYTLMLRILCNKETLDEFWGLAKKVSEDGCDIDIGTYAAIMANFKRWNMRTHATAWTAYFTKMNEESATAATVKRVVDVILGSDWNNYVEMKLVELEVTFSENVVLNTFLGLNEYPMKALLFFRWLGEYSGYTHSAVTYNGILRVLSQQQSVKEFWIMVKEMKNAGHELDLDTYVKVSRHFQKSGLVEDLVELYELMVDGPYKPIQDCGLILRDIALAVSPDLRLAFRVFKKYEEAGYAPSKTVYDGMYRCLTVVGKFDEAEKILVTMRNEGFEPDNTTYAFGLFGLGKEGKLAEGIKMLDEIEAKECSPNFWTWTSLIRGLCTGGEIDKALKCYTMMSEKNLKVEAFLLDMLVNALCSKGRADSAYTLVFELVKKADIRPMRSTYICLSQNLMAEGKLEEGMHLLCLMKKHKFGLFRDPCVEYISKSGTVEDARELLKLYSTNNSSAYLHVLQSFLKEGRQTEARDLLNKYPDPIRNHANVANLFTSVVSRNVTT